MSSLYIHIPFCKSRCIYCGFYSTTQLPMMRRYVDAILAEMRLRQGYVDWPPRTIYIGGGTPSALPTELLGKLLGAIDMSKAEEVTVECNPDDITEQYAAQLSRLPINRVSMGAQTFDDGRLRLLRRRHSAEDVGRAVARLRSAGIDNVSIDLMYGFPSETMSQWQSDIEAALSLDVEHISAYCLSYEPGTALHRLRDEGRINEASDELCRQMYYELIDRLNAAGYEHYETSNFARHGRRSKHNSGYWNATPYMGLGAAAHSYDGMSRQWNVASLNHYIEAIESGVVPMEREELDATTRYNDTVMLALRTAEGIDLRLIEEQYGKRMASYCLRMASKYIGSGLVERQADSLRLTRDGWFVGDMVASDLMMVE